jgi:hypothetical protein
LFPQRPIIIEELNYKNFLAVFLNKNIMVKSSMRAVQQNKGKLICLFESEDSIPQIRIYSKDKKLFRERKEKEKEIQSSQNT